jgi:hypothetical protein
MCAMASARTGWIACALVAIALAGCGDGGARIDAGADDGGVCRLTGGCDIIGPQCPTPDDLCLTSCGESFECCWCSDAGPEVVFIHCVPCDAGVPDAGTADAGTADAG